MEKEAAMSTATITKMALTLEEVAQMLQEPVSSIRIHCRTQALKGAYKTGRGKTAPWRIPPAAIDHYQRTRPRQ